MTNQGINWGVWCGVNMVLVLGAAGALRSETILVDDFNDGNDDGWTHFDNTGGYPWGPATYDASSYAYHLEGADLVPTGELGSFLSGWDGSSDPIFANGYLRATVRADSEESLVWLVTRGQTGAQPEIFSIYLFGASPSTGRFFFNKWVDRDLVQEEGFDAGAPFEVGEDWIIEAGSVGDELSMRVWQPGEPEPLEPQWTLTDSTLPEGLFGLGASHRRSQPAALVSATFDDIFFRPIFLQAGDADQDLDFDQLDLVQVQLAAKYLTGDPATWGEGDWNGAPGGFPGGPPEGDGVFNQLDIVAAQQAAVYLTGAYAGLHGEALVAAVPEPSTVLLLAVGLMTLAMWVGRRCLNR